MKASLLVVSICFILIATLSAQTYPIPLLNTPVVPATARPGGAAFTLTVNGSGFTPQSQVWWNKRARATTFVSNTQLTAAILQSDIRSASTATVTVTNPGPHRSNPVFFQVTKPEQSISMQVVPTGLSGQPIAADLNADGIADMIVWNSSTLQIARGLGNGVFGAPQTYTFVDPVEAVAVGDPSGSGKPDIAVATVGKVQILPNNGDGTFGKILTVANLSLNSIAVADLDGNGFLDIVGTILGSPGDIVVILQVAPKVFDIPVESPAGNGPMFIVVGDFNRDNIPDLAVLNFDDSISIFLGIGEGMFQAPTTYSSGSSGDFPTGFVVADVNGDGKLDLARSAALFTAGTGILLGNGDGTFQADHNYGSSSYGLTSGDFNGDGILDLAMGLNASGTGILLGAGDGTFPILDNFDFVDLGFGVSAADFNNNGRLDLAAITHNGVVVLMQ